MSISTWKKEFYSKIKEKMTDKERAEHVLKKYTGALKENLIKHEVIKLKEESYIEDKKSKTFYFDIESCSFCEKYFKPSYYEKNCDGCPLFKEEGVSCFNEKSSYAKFTKTSNPNKLISLMKKIIKKCDDKGKYNV